MLQVIAITGTGDRDPVDHQPITITGIRTAYRAIDNHVYQDVRYFLTRRHKMTTRGITRFPTEAVFGKLGVLRLRRVHLGAPPRA